jgi:phosphoglycolate phosphatase-like HAD superfamily hydrolase
MLENFKIIFWDFDGVLMDSNAIRDVGFERVLSNYPKQAVQDLLIYHRENGGLSRYVKFRYFFENILKKDVSESEIKELATNFSLIMRSQLLNPELLISDSMNFVKSQFDCGVRMHIVSGSDQEELRFICNELQIAKYFISIHGSPTPKTQLVKDLIDSNGYTKSRIVLIGDSVNDFEAATLNGIAFSGYNNFALSDIPNYIISLNKNRIFE